MHHCKLIVPLVFSLISFEILFCQSESEGPIVEIPTGKVQGIFTKTRKGRDISAFYGIRYAEPPTGSNRFKPPIPAKKFNGVYKAHTEGQACLQILPLPGLTYSEDCLFLDVYTTNLNASKPVIVYIHGGAFILFSKSLASYEYLLDKDIVLVCINYRLGAFGFFSMGTKEASGNQGFKDQVLAIKWVRENIKAFGGNPDLITLSGQSAGSFSVTMHLVSKQSVGLFHRAIAMSGSGFSYIESKTRRASYSLILRTACFRFSKAHIIDCLQYLPADVIIEASKEMIAPLAWYYDVEKEDDDQPFLTEKPIEIARRGEIQKVPIMTGVTLDEFYVAAYEIHRYIPILLGLFSIPLHKLILPYALMYDRNPNKNEISSTLYSFYMEDQPITSRNLHNFGALLSDTQIRHGVHRLVEYTRNITDVYYYRFDYHGPYRSTFHPDGKPFGVLHTDDVQYVLVSKLIAPVANASDPRNFMIDRMINWWANFAETGNPNDSFDSTINGVIWEPSDGIAVRALYIDEKCKMSSEFFMPEYKLLDSLFPLYKNEE